MFQRRFGCIRGLLCRRGDGVGVGDAKGRQFEDPLVFHDRYYFVKMCRNCHERWQSANTTIVVSETGLGCNIRIVIAVSHNLGWKPHGSGNDDRRERIALRFERLLLFQEELPNEGFQRQPNTAVERWDLGTNIE